jgi:hypothetical protein
MARNPGFTAEPRTLHLNMISFMKQLKKERLILSIANQRSK